MIGLDSLADIYTPDGETGAYTVLAKSGLAVRLAHVGAIAAGPGGERVELSGTRRLLWDEDYTMPAEAQVEVEGERWNVKKGSGTTMKGPGGRVVYRRIDVVASG